MTFKLRDQEAINQSYGAGIAKLFDVFWQSYILGGDHKHAEQAFCRGMVSLRNARERAIELLDGMTDKDGDQIPTSMPTNPSLHHRTPGG